MNCLELTPASFGMCVGGGYTPATPDSAVDALTDFESELDYIADCSPVGDLDQRGGLGADASFSAQEGAWEAGFRAGQELGLLQSTGDSNVKAALQIDIEEMVSSAIQFLLLSSGDGMGGERGTPSKPPLSMLTGIPASTVDPFYWPGRFTYSAAKNLHREVFAAMDPEAQGEVGEEVQEPLVCFVEVLSSFPQQAQGEAITSIEQWASSWTGAGFTLG